MNWVEIAATAITSHGAVQQPTELATLLEILALSPPRVVLEIGADRGGTVWAWKQLPGPPEVIAVDSYRGPGMSAGPVNLHGAALVTGDSHDASTVARVHDILSTGRVDFLFIDADHSYEAVRADWQTYGPLLRPGGLAAFHDLRQHESMPPFGVDRLFNEISVNRWACRIIAPDRGEWGGIGVITVAPPGSRPT